MRVIKSVFLGVTCLIASVSGAKAENTALFKVAGDLVSSYVWRGQYQTGASVQPTLGFIKGGFSMTAWGSVDITGKEAKEVDLTMAYSFKGLTLSVADLWWAGEQADNYFHFKSHETDHFFEAGLAYQLPCQKFPLTFAWNTMFAGADKKANGNQAYSTYVELGYPFAVKQVDLNLFCGFTPWDAPLYGTDSFNVVNVGLKASKIITITEQFSLPIFSQLIWNPEQEKVHLVFGITLGN